MNITERVLSFHKKGIEMHVRRAGDWAAAITLQRGERGVSLLFTADDLENARIDRVGLRIDHAVQAL